MALDISCEINVSAGGGGGGGGEGIAPYSDWRGYQTDYDGGTTGDIFVSPTGSDVNAGTLALPKKTISAALSAATSGQVIKLRGGIYRETVTIPTAKGGSAGNPTEISNYGSEVPVLSGREPMTGLTACTSGDASVVGALWSNMYKVTLSNSLIASGDPLVAAPAEAGRMMPLASELVQSPKYPVEPYGIDDWAEWEVILSGSNITGYRNPAVTDNYTQAQIEAMVVCFYRSPNLADFTTVASFSPATKIITLANTGTTYGSGINKDKMSLKNCVSRIRQGQWAFVDNGNGTSTYYLWPLNPANIASSMEYCARDTGIDCNGASHLLFRGLIIEGTGGISSDSKTNLQPLVQKSTTPTADIKVYNLWIRDHYRITGRETYLVLMQEVDDFWMHNCTFSGGWGMYGIHPQGAPGETISNKTKGLWINKCVFYDISSSAIRVYQSAFGAVTHCLARHNVGMSPHANVFDPKQQSHFILAHANDFTGSTGYATYQQASAVHFTMNFIHGNTKPDDKRVIWDQSSNGDGPAATASEGRGYWLGNHFAPDVQDLALWNAIKGGVSSTAPITADNNICWNAYDQFINSNVTRGNRNIVPQGSTVGSELTETPSTTYVDRAIGDFRIGTGSAIRGTRGNSGAAVRTALTSGISFLTSDTIDKDINGVTFSWSNPPIGPAEGGDFISAGAHWVTIPAVTSGTLAGGQTVTMDAGTKYPGHLSPDSKWLYSTDGGFSWTAISGADTASYTIPASGWSGRWLAYDATIRGNTVRTVLGAVA